MEKNIYFMGEALKEAHKAFADDEVPVGAVIVHKDKIIAKAYNQIRLLKDPTAHAEIIAITQAANYFKNERLLDAILYVTLEPCPMCVGAIILSRIKKLVYAIEDPKTGACGSVVDLVTKKLFNHRLEVETGILAHQSAELLKEFFRKKRNKPSR